MTQPSAIDRVRGLVGAAGAGATGQQTPEPVNPFATKASDLKGAIGTLSGMMPDASAPGYKADPEQFAIDFQTWLSTYLDASDAYSAIQQSAFGFVTLPDGSMMPTGDLDPQQRAIFDAANEAKYQNTLSALGLQQSNLIADRAQAGFDNKLKRLAAATNVDDTRLRKSEGEISRALGGLSESRSRAQTIAQAKLDAAPFGTSNGKTSFSANDLGSLLGEFSNFVGVDPNSSLLKYTGTSMIDPESDMAKYDSLLGVGGALPQFGSLLSGSDGYGIPGEPDLGGVPSLTASRVNIPSAAAPAAGLTGAGVGQQVGGKVAALLKSLLGGGGGGGNTAEAPRFSDPSSFNTALAGETPETLLAAASGGWKSRIGGN